MKTLTFGSIAALVVLALGASLVGAHARNYNAVPGDTPVWQCVDDQFTVLGTGGAVGGALNTVGATVDPVYPDIGGSCYRPNHIVPNLNGDVTISGVDQTQNNLAVCVSQDSDGDGGFCFDDGDFEGQFCNGGTVNVNFPVANAWRFQDSQGVPARRTLIGVYGPVTAGSLLAIITLCGEGVDQFGTLGEFNHS